MFLLSITKTIVKQTIVSGISRAAATSKMEYFVIIVNGSVGYLIIIKNSRLVYIMKEHRQVIVRQSYYSVMLWYICILADIRTQNYYWRDDMLLLYGLV